MTSGNDDLPGAPRTLDQLAIGETGTVASVLGEQGLAQRLLEMGLIPGTEVCLIRLAPLGDPREVQLRGYHLSIRKSDARQIELAGAES